MKCPWACSPFYAISVGYSFPQTCKSAANHPSAEFQMVASFLLLSSQEGEKLCHPYLAAPKPWGWWNVKVAQGQHRGAGAVPAPCPECVIQAPALAPAQGSLPAHGSLAQTGMQADVWHSWDTANTAATAWLNWSISDKPGLWQLLEASPELCSALCWSRQVQSHTQFELSCFPLGWDGEESIKQHWHLQQDSCKQGKHLPPPLFSSLRIKLLHLPSCWGGGTGAEAGAGLSITFGH